MSMTKWNMRATIRAVRHPDQWFIAPYQPTLAIVMAKTCSWIASVE